ncbi:MAG: hypothetical protein Q9186_000112 [Xanthomendoza sp. 1 TL-2023]
MTHTSNNDLPTIQNSTVSILDWIRDVPPSPHTPISPDFAPSFEAQSPTPSRPHLKRRHESESLPSEFLGDRPSLRKRRRPLHEMPGNMQPPYVTPVKGSSSSSGIGSSTASQNISPTKSSLALKTRNSQYNAGRAMDNQGMVLDEKESFFARWNNMTTQGMAEHDKELRNNYLLLEGLIESITASERLSGVEPASAAKITAYRAEYARHNEATFLRIMWPLLMKDGYHAVKDSARFSKEEKDLIKGEDTIYKDFLTNEGIVMTLDTDILRDMIPSNHEDPEFETNLAKALAKDKDRKMKNPRPDYAYGFSPSTLPGPTGVTIPDHILAMMDIAPRTRHAFFFGEGKTDGGSVAEAEDQARRGGATLVGAHRDLIATVTELLDVPGPDLDTIVFSVTISPQGYGFYVHWYEGPSTKALYHMTKFDEVSLYSKVDHEKIRRNLHNIIEWGSTKRCFQLMMLHEQIGRWCRHTPTTRKSGLSVEETSPLPSSLQLKRRRNSDSLPLVFLGDTSLLRRRGRPLHEISGNMFPPPYTPQSKRSSSTSGDSQSSTSSTSGAITQSSAAESLKTRGNPLAIREEMKRNGLLHNNAAFQKYPAFVSKIKLILGKARESPMQPWSAEKIGKNRDFLECYNEATFVHTIWPMMMKDGYHLTKDRTDFTEEQKERLLETQGTLYRNFLLHEGVVGTLDTDFLRNMVPNIHDDPKFMQYITQALAKDTRMKNPRPDYTYGLAPDKFSDPVGAPLPDNIAALCGLAPGTWHAFFIVEGKGKKGSVQVAEDQVRGGGAGLVNAHRQLKAKLGLLNDEVGPDEDTFVFSATITTKNIEFWVHWYEGPSATQKFHMNRVGTVLLTKNFDDHQNYDEIRQKLHNIVEWGAIDRFGELQNLHERIGEYSREQRAQQVAEAQAGQKNKKAKLK